MNVYLQKVQLSSKGFDIPLEILYLFLPLFFSFEALLFQLIAWHILHLDLVNTQHLTIFLLLCHLLFELAFFSHAVLQLYLHFLSYELRILQFFFPVF